MDYAGQNILPLSPFTVGKSSVWLNVRKIMNPKASININGYKEYWMSYREGLQNIEELITGQIPIVRQDVPIKWRLVPSTFVSKFDGIELNKVPLAADLSVTMVEHDTSVSSPLPQPTLHYSDFGSAMVQGDKPWKVDLDVSLISNGRLVVQIHDAVVCDEGYGVFTLYTSSDKKSWSIVDQGGFPDGEFQINQKSIRTGSIVWDDFIFARLARYIRISYEPRDIRAWGFKARVTIDANIRRQ